MSLTLTIRNVASLENGMPTEFVLHRRGATIGRAATCDWSLPDPHRYISSRHCEISFRDEAYWVADTSTNGTFVNGAQERLPAEKKLEQGDVVLIGHYEIVAQLSGSAAPAPAPEAPVDTAENFPGWEKWDNRPKEAAPAPASGASGWDSPAPAASGAPAAPSSGWGPPAGGGPETSSDSRFRWGASGSSDPAPAAPASGWGPSHNASDMPHGGSVWQAEEAAPDPASGWSSAAPDRPPPPSTDDIWGKIAEGNVVDWARGGFGAPAPAPQSDPLGLNKQQSAAEAFGAPMAPPSTAAAPARTPTRAPTQPPTPRAAAPKATAAAGGGDTAQLLTEFLTAAGIDPGSVKGTPAEIARRGGSLVRRLVAGLVVLVEARARAKSQMGAESTRLEFDGNNPIKFARSPEQAIAQLLNPKEKGFMDSERAIEDSYYDLQSHQMATLRAMQGALRATLDRFAPEAIRKRAVSKGVLSKVLPGARDAALWQSYEREFGGVAQGSDEAFMDVFAKEFRKAYEEASRSRR